MLKYEHAIDSSLYDTKEDCFEIAGEYIDEEQVWEALRDDFTIYDILKAVFCGNEEMYFQAYNKAIEWYVDNYFMKIEVEEDDD